MSATRGAELLALPAQTYATAAELLQCSPSAIARLVTTGELPAVRLGPRLVRIPTAAIIERLDAQVAS